MLEIEKLLTDGKKDKQCTMSLMGKLEAIVGNYFLSEMTFGIYRGLWNMVYFDPDIDSEIQEVACTPKNLIGYVDREERWAFILDQWMQKFQDDTAEYGLRYISVPSLQQKILQCNHTDNLVCEFSGIVWIDDDFMNDEKVPFDFKQFAIIDTGKRYLNPKHFSVDELIKYTQLEVAGKKG